jgi:hypothetical protein
MSDEADIIYPPTHEQIVDLRTHHVGLALRLATRLGRPLTESEYAMFERRPEPAAHALVELPNGRLGVA